jgi:hypothetical protein
VAAASSGRLAGVSVGNSSTCSVEFGMVFNIGSGVNTGLQADRMNIPVIPQEKIILFRLVLKVYLKTGIPW